MKAAVTLTTIHTPVVIEKYLANAVEYGHKDIEMLVIGDRKTPSGVDEYCRIMSSRYGIPVRYMGLEAQIDYMKRFPSLDRHLPFDSFSRRNIGDLLIFEEGAPIIIRVDDDNAPIPEDFIGLHCTLGAAEHSVVSSDNGWFNICGELVERDNIPFYPRGYPYSKRWKDGKIKHTKRTVKTVLNAGLWLGDPDVDAVTRLAKPIDALDYRGSYGRQFVLETGTWSPIDTQNTAYARHVIPASFISPYVGRYDDIWSGYLLRTIMDHLGEFVSFGRPLLRQDRNEHNLWKDLEAEMNGNLHTDHLIDTLRRIRLTSKNYTACYRELAEQLQGQLTENRSIFLKLTEGMLAWVEAVEKITPR